MFVRKVFLAAAVIFLFTNAAITNKSGKKELVFSFHVNDKPGFHASFQMAIWLEKPDGSYVKTLYVSDYLSYGGFNHKEICPDWIAKSGWEQASGKEVDAVTGATFLTGDQSIGFACSKKQIPPGKYKYFIEIHLQENYNELYSGEIEVGKEDTESVPEVKFIPEKHPKGGGMLSNIIVKCKSK